jgi:hypothetical protein
MGQALIRVSHKIKGSIISDDPVPFSENNKIFYNELAMWLGYANSRDL